MHAGASRRRLRDRHSRRAHGDPRRSRVPVSRRAGRRSGRSPPAAVPTSATSSWPRGCRSSSGAACRTRSCCAAPSAASCTSRRFCSAQVQRMLADPRSETLASNFAFQWLNMAKLAEIRAGPGDLPDTRTATSASDFREELRLFVDSIFRENRNVLDLLTRRLHVPERAPRAALRHPRRQGRPVPARAARPTRTASDCWARARS